jgi:uncharacterized protein
VSAYLEELRAAGVPHTPTGFPIFDLLLIGMGTEMARPPRPVRAALEAAGIIYDPMATGHAVSTYDLLLEEKRRVAAALIAVAFGA